MMIRHLSCALITVFLLSCLEFAIATSGGQTAELQLAESAESLMEVSGDAVLEVDNQTNSGETGAIIALAAEIVQQKDDGSAGANGIIEVSDIQDINNEEPALDEDPATEEPIIDEDPATEEPTIEEPVEEEPAEDYNTEEENAQLLPSLFEGLQEVFSNIVDRINEMLVGIGEYLAEVQEMVRELIVEEVPELDGEPVPLPEDPVDPAPEPEDHAYQVNWGMLLLFAFMGVLVIGGFIWYILSRRDHIRIVDDETGELLETRQIKVYPRTKIDLTDALEHAYNDAVRVQFLKPIINELQGYRILFLLEDRKIAEIETYRGELEFRVSLPQPPQEEEHKGQRPQEQGEQQAGRQNMRQEGQPEPASPSDSSNNDETDETPDLDDR